MADYFTNDEELTAVADAIREKTGGNDPLRYEDGFVGAIRGIQTSQEAINDNVIGVNTTWSSSKINTELGTKLDPTKLAPDYSTLTFPIAYGTYCVHNAGLYKASQDIPTAEAWTSGHWTPVNVMGETGQAVLYRPQALSTAQKMQATANIGALNTEWGQTLTDDQKQAVRSKIGLPLIDWNANWTEAQKKIARDNLGVAKGGLDEDLAAGTAMDVIGDPSETDTELYTYRKTGGSTEAGNRERLNKIIGGTVAWNQLANNDNAPTSRNSMTIENGGSVFTINGTANASNSATGWFGFANSMSLEDHVIFLSYKLLSGTVSKPDDIKFAPVYTKSADLIAIGETAIKKVPNGLNSNTGKSYWFYTDGCEFTNAVMQIQVFDLTQMFGSTIADAIYAMETATPGAGVAWFRNLFPADYYAYDAGSLQSVNVAAHRLTGFNQWDEEWELGDFSYISGNASQSTTLIRSKNYIPVMPNTSYYFQSPMPQNVSIFIYAYDKDKKYIGAYLRNGTWVKNGRQYANKNIAIMPWNCRYIRISSGEDYGATYKHDICINLSDPAKNGIYEPYAGHTYPMGNVDLRGIPSLVDGKLVYDGDEYKPDGSVTRKYGIVDLGTKSWTRGNYNNIYYYITSISGAKVPAVANRINNLICGKYIQVATAGVTTDFIDKSFFIYTNGSFYIRDDSYTDAATFKTAMSGVMLVYELATPTTETTDPYNPVQICDPSGTEEFVDRAYEAGTRDVEIPVQHSTDYFVPVIDYIDENVTEVSERKADVITSTASGAIATFTDGADDMPMALTVGIKPVQDLHGYENPWPGGGGKNLLNYSVANVSTNSTNFNNGITIKANQAYTFSYYGNSNVSIIAYYHGTSDRLFTSGYVNTYTYTPTEDVEIDITFYNSSGVTSAENLFQLETGSTSTAWQPYSNICPITGWTGAEISRTGKNLFGGLALGNKIVSVVNVPANTYLGSDDNGDYVTFSAGSALSNKPPIFTDFKPNTRYTFILRMRKEPTNSTATNLYISYTDGTGAALSSLSESGELQTLVYTSANNKSIADIHTAFYGGRSYLYYNESGIFEGVLTADDFEPYAGSTYEIEFPEQAGTVYGGTLSINKDGTGSLVVDRANVDLGTLTWAKSSSGLKYVGTLPSVSYKYSDKTKFLCTNYKFDGAGYSSRGYFGADKTYRYWHSPGPASTVREVYIHDESYSDAATFKTAMSGVMLVYELEEPTVYQLTAPQIRTLLGMNNVWADTGNTTADYPADTKLYIDKALSASRNLMELIVTANREDSMKATKAYSTGNLLIVNGTLYKATTSIANGATLTVGTNVTATTVAAELAALA